MMSETRTLQFESPRALQSLYANDIRLLKNLEDSLGVKVTTREGWVKLEGDPSRVDKAQHVFEQLEKARQQGVEIQKHEFNYALKAVSEERDENLGDVVSTKITTSHANRPLWREVQTSGRMLRQFKSMMLFLESDPPAPAKPTSLLPWRSRRSRKSRWHVLF